MNSPSRGFTLLEILMILAILAILLAIGVPGYLQALQAARLQEAASVVATTLQGVAGKAVKTSQAMTLSASSSGGQLSWQYAGQPAQEQVTLPYGVTVLTMTPDATVDYTGRGIPDEQYVITLSRGSKTKQVILLVTGKVVVK